MSAQTAGSGRARARARCAPALRWLWAFVAAAATLLGPAAAAQAAPPALPTPAPATPATGLPPAAPCPGPALAWQALAPGLWWLPAADGDATAANRGQVSNLLLAQDGKRLWLLGSGPSPAFGRTLACSLQQQLGLRVTDVVSPWPRPELVLGLAGLGPVRHWGHAEVARAMQQRCAHCVQRLRQRLGEAETDLGADPVRLPTRLLHGSQGRLGPWRWWRLSRGSGYPVTVWQHQAHGLMFAPGLLWGDGAPDGRDADIGTLSAATQALQSLPGARPQQPPAWLGEQGPPLAPMAAQAQARYWAELQAAVAAALERGDSDASDIGGAGGMQGGSPTAAGVAAGDARHALNRQRAWRQAEEAWLQRSLR